MVSMAAAAGMEEDLLMEVYEMDPMIFESQVKGSDLCAYMSENDPLHDDIGRGYTSNKVFRKILEKPEDHLAFLVQDGFI